jgi:D-alanyl-D-alanine carboxypeptidase
VRSGQALFQKFPDQRRPMASTTKLMTGLLAAESGRLDEIATVSRAAAQIGETTMGLYEGERVSLRDLLFGLMMNSGNDAALAIAEHLSGSVPAFAAAMNARAAELGLANTRFVNPHGLDHGPYFSPNQYASARDLATLGALALRTPVLAEASGGLLREVSAGPGRPTHRLRHSLSALWWYPGTLGGKTGWTGRAGQVRVAGAERGGTRLIAVVMDSPDHVAETRDLLDYGFAFAGTADARASVPVGADALPQPDAKLTQAWQSFKRVALSDDGRIRRGATGDDAGADAQAAALLHAVWMRDRRAFDAIWGWTNLALSRRIDHPANPKRMALFASRWSRGTTSASEPAPRSSRSSDRKWTWNRTSPSSSSSLASSPECAAAASSYASSTVCGTIERSSCSRSHGHSRRSRRVNASRRRSASTSRSSSAAT